MSKPETFAMAVAGVLRVVPMFLLLLVLNLYTIVATPCLGEFVQCPNGSCVLDATQDCNACPSGGYLCPTISGNPATCISDISKYTSCPGLQGTHLDATLTEHARLEYIASHTTLLEQIAQLQNAAPAIHDQGIPAYQWLNDDQHGVARTPANATVFPNGVGLGATFDTALIKQVGFVVGNEVGVSVFNGGPCTMNTDDAFNTDFPFLSLRLHELSM